MHRAPFLTRDFPTGIATTVGIYLDVLEDLARRRKFNIYVQPVAPVSQPLCRQPTLQRLATRLQARCHDGFVTCDSGVE